MSELSVFSLMHLNNIVSYESEFNYSDFFAWKA